MEGERNRGRGIPGNLPRFLCNHARLRAPLTSTSVSFTTGWVVAEAAFSGVPLCGVDDGKDPGLTFVCCAANEGALGSMDLEAVSA